MENFSVEVATADAVSLDKNLADLPLVYGSDKIAVDDISVEGAGAVKRLEQPNHDETDDEP